MSESRFSTDNVKFPPAKPAHLDFADVNYNGDWMKSLDKIGFCCVVVQMARNNQVLQEAKFCDALDESLKDAAIGHYDSSQYQPKIRHFFYVNTDRLAQALDLVTRYLFHVALLEHSVIAHFDAADKKWRLHDHGITFP